MGQQAEPKGTILDTLSTIMEIQELDMQMIQLMNLKKEREKELENVNKVKKDLSTQAKVKEVDILEIKANLRVTESELQDVQERIKKLENQQSSIKKVEEFNALSQEMSHVDREKNQKEHNLSDLYDRLAHEEENLKAINASLAETIESSHALEHEIIDRLTKINEEGRQLLVQRQKLVLEADQDVFSIYERLLKNKKDRVVVPIENRCCSGCHIALTAQDENLVRKAERLVFCEHCSRILFWVNAEELEAGAATLTRPRRRRSTTRTTT